MASFQLVQNSDDAKVMHATSRATKLHFKRQQFARACANTSSGRQAGTGVKPHRASRAAARTSLAHGVIGLQGDMPSIVCRDSAWSRRCTARKPAVASRVQHGHVDDFQDKSLLKEIFDIEDVSTTDEYSDGEQQTGSETEISQDVAASVPCEVLDMQYNESMWPVMSNSVTHAEKDNPSQGGVPSHRDIAIRGMLVDLEERKSLARLRAKKAAETRALQQALEWKKVTRKQSNQAHLSRAQCHTSSVPSVDVPRLVCPDEDIREAKLMRAASRATKLHIERSQYGNPRGARSSGRRVGDGVKPHRNVRAATRTCLARGAVDAQEDMPSIIRLGTTWSRNRPARKPTVAPRMRYSNRDDIFDDAALDSDLEVRNVNKKTTAIPTRASSREEDIVVLPTPKRAQLVEAEQPDCKPIDKRGSCVIS